MLNCSVDMKIIVMLLRGDARQIRLQISILTHCGEASTKAMEMPETFYTSSTLILLDHPTLLAYREQPA